MHWWETKTAAFSFLLLGLGGGGVVTYLSPLIGIPLCIIIILVGICLLLRAYKYRDKTSKIDAIIQELENKYIAGYSSLDIFDALRDSLALGLTYPQIHNILKGKLPGVVGWGLHSSDILATFEQLGLIHSTSIDPHFSTVLLDFKYEAPNFVYQLTEKGNLLAHKLMSQKPKIRKEGFQT